MILNNETAEVSPPPRIEFRIGNLTFDMLKRDPRLWLLALRRRWWLLLLLPALTTTLALIYLLSRPPQYESRAVLLRQVPRDYKDNGLPEGFSQLQMVDIINLIRRHGNMTKTLSRLQLDWSLQALYQHTEVRQPAKQSNIIYLSAQASTPELAANIANTLTNVFLDDYRALLRSNLTALQEANATNRQKLQTALSEQQNSYLALLQENKMIAFSEVSNSLQLQIQTIESTLLQQASQYETYASQLAMLQQRLSETEPQIKRTEEVSTAQQTELEAKKLELVTKLQTYTEENPIIQKLREEIRLKTEELAKNGDQTSTKIIFGDNPIYTTLLAEVTKLEAAITGNRKSMEYYRKELEKLQKRREELSRLQPRVIALEDQIDATKRSLDRLDEAQRLLDMFLQRSYSDVSVTEDAIVPDRPVGRGRVFITAAAAGGGFLLAMFILLLIELFNLTIRSKTDLSEALHLEVIGVLPERTPKNRVDFYSALQSMVASCDATLAGAERPAVVMIGTLSQKDWDEGLFNEILEVLAIKDINFLRIRSGEEPSSTECRYLLNDYLYGLADTPPRPEKTQHLFFKLDDLAFIAPPTPARLLELRSAFQDYDVILWELFEYQSNPQLFQQLSAVADLVVLPATYGKTGKIATAGCRNALQKAAEHAVIGGLLYNIESKYYHWVN